MAAYESGHLGILNWLVIGGLLAITALFKGAQPAAYFALGVGAFIVWSRDWNQIGGYCLAGAVSLGALGVWIWAAVQPGDLAQLLAYARLANMPTLDTYLIHRLDFAFKLIVFFLPIMIVLLPAAVSPGLWKRIPEDHRPLLMALLMYGLAATAVLFLWPGSRLRYAMPAVLPLACAAGLLIDSVSPRIVRRLAAAALGALMVYQIAWGWIVAPALPDIFGQARIAAISLDNAMAGTPGTLYARVRLLDKVLAHLDRPVRYLPASELASLNPPAFVLAGPKFADQIAARAQTVTAVAISSLPHRGGLKLYRLEAAVGR